MKIAATIATFTLLLSACAQGPPDSIRAAGPSSPPVERLRGEDAAARFAVLGDFGSATSNQTDVANQMCAWREDHPFNLVVTTGDNIYETGHPDMFGPAFFEPYACLLEAGVRFRATLGNHDIITDGGRPELQEPAFGMKSRNYVVRNAGVRLVMVNSNDLRMGWLERHLTPASGDRWTIVVFHHPVYSSGEHGSTPGLRPALPRLFRAKGVDLVLNGHDHNYEAIKKLRGIRYVVTGGGGAHLRSCGEPQWFTARCLSRHHFLYVRAGRERIKVEAVGVAGRVFHSFRTRGRT